MDPVAFGGVRFFETDLAPVTIFFKYIDVDGFFDCHNNVSVTTGFVADVDGGVRGDGDSGRGVRHSGSGGDGFGAKGRGGSWIWRLRW